jgi:hypothetical protein
MGCFTFKCKKTNETICEEDYVHLFLLKQGKVIEHMYGEYDSYGRVRNNSGESFHWNMPWKNVCDLCDMSSNKGDGLAAILGTYWNEGDPYPTTQSEDADFMGWCYHRDHVGNPLGIKPYHKVF